MFLSNFLSDAPPNSRLFIISGKGLKEDIFRREFEKFGKITDVWVVRDKQTNEPKGGYHEFSWFSVFLFVLPTE